MNITPYDASIRQLFQSSFYKIPRFQRPYSWDKGNIEEFWTDAILSGKQGYFIGSMVFYGKKNGQDLFVVDGQQRLTTVTIFLSAVRDTLLSIGESALAYGIQKIIQRPDVSNEDRFVLLTESSYPYLQEYVQKIGASDLTIEAGEEEKGIMSAYNYAMAELQKIIVEITDAESNLKKRQNLIKKRLESARDALLSLDVVVIQVDNEDDAHVVFETLNTRGKDLEPKDLIKNLLTRLLPAKSADVDTTKLKWSAMMKSIGQSAVKIDVSTYLHHHWLSTYEYTPERTLFSKVKGKIDKSTATSYLNSIVEDVDLYRRVFEPDNFAWAKEEEPLRRSLLALSIFKVRQPTPLLLSVLRAYYAGRISLKQARDVFSAVERFHFMHTAIAGLSSSGGVSMMYAAAARELSSEQDAQKRAKHLQDFRAKLKARTPDKETFVAGFSELRYSQADTRGRPLIRYILEKLDSGARTGPPVDYSQLTIEHLASQNPDSTGVKAENYPMIGNLLFISQPLNQKLKNRKFETKKTILKNAKVPLDDIILSAAEWGDVEIVKRTRAMADRAYEFVF